jgi:hypothetical protein
VKTPDFGIAARLRARAIVSSTPPAAKTETIGEVTSLEHVERRRGVPEQLEPGEIYADVVIEKWVVGEIANERPSGEKQPG